MPSHGRCAGDNKADFNFIDTSTEEVCRGFKAVAPAPETPPTAAELPIYLPTEAESQVRSC